MAEEVLSASQEVLAIEFSSDDDEHPPAAPPTVSEAMVRELLALTKELDDANEAHTAKEAVRASTPPLVPNPGRRSGIFTDSRWRRKVEEWPRSVPVRREHCSPEWPLSSASRVHSYCGRQRVARPGSRPRTRSSRRLGIASVSCYSK